ncbi:hypothetical protein [Candidatus Thiosymbion oneisti]|uniref:hypothetical protein n=1 Tax=Candidatus Thiosymbion oneisti TaxID=589554 RepID=UPI00106096B6|nr:hypothetical protein [Candidatus Thiosymbion oneisti]
MIASRPSFEVMQKAYPKGTAAEVKKLIGGKVDAAWITNTCVIRLSRALNYSGAQHKIRRTPTMNTITGSDAVAVWCQLGSEKGPGSIDGSLFIAHSPNIRLQATQYHGPAPQQLSSSVPRGIGRLSQAVRQNNKI